MRWIQLMGLIGLLAAMLWAPGRPAAAQSPERRWLAEPLLLVEGASAAWIDIAPVDATHVWAVAGKRVLFFDGAAWSVQFTAPGILEDIAMDGPTRGWAIGADARGFRGRTFYAFDGVAWRPAPAPSSEIYRLAVAGDGTLIGAGGNGVPGSNARATLEWFDGAEWRIITPFDRGSYAIQVAPDKSTWIWGNAYGGISSYDAPTPFALRYERGALSPSGLPAAGPGGPEMVSRDGLTSVLMQGRSAGWASMVTTAGQQKVYRYDGAAWAEAPLPAEATGGAEYKRLTFVAGDASELIAALAWDGSISTCGRHTMLRLAGGAWSAIGETPSLLSGRLVPGSGGRGWFSSVDCADPNQPARRFRLADGALSVDDTGSDVVPSAYYLAGPDAQWAVAPGMIMRYAASALPTGPVAAAPGARYFPETGHNLSGAFRAFYERYGLEFGDPGVSPAESLALFGLPLTEPFSELNPDTGEYLQVQYFERVRMEFHPQNPEPYKVLLGRMGAVRYVQSYGSIYPGEPQAPPAAGCERFAETKRDLCPPFREYWRSVGSVQIFGLPIADARDEPSYTDGATYPTLWTERERLEHHRELAGTRYEILLGLLAKEDLRMRGYLE
ncbi:MAG TPA: hypothetical protein VGE07_27660 [Herpetosiphonaceae bacterium]